jgi:hypothetical protein
MRTEPALRNQIYSAPEQVFQFLGKREVILEPARVVQCDEKVDIAVWPFFATRHRSEQADIRSAVARRYFRNGDAVLLNLFEDGHSFCARQP